MRDVCHYIPQILKLIGFSGAPIPFLQFGHERAVQ